MKKYFLTVVSGMLLLISLVGYARDVSFNVPTIDTSQSSADAVAKVKQIDIYNDAGTFKHTAYISISYLSPNSVSVSLNDKCFNYNGDPEFDYESNCVINFWPAKGNPCQVFLNMTYEPAKAQQSTGQLKQPAPLVISCPGS